MRGVVREGVKIIVGNANLFGVRGDFSVPILYPFEPVPEERLVHFWVAGTWSALHIARLGIFPDPITPWWIFAATSGESAFPPDYNIIRILDPAAGQTLKPWFNFHANDILPQLDYVHPVRQLLVNYLDLNDVGSDVLNMIHSFHHALVHHVLWSTERRRSFQNFPCIDQRTASWPPKSLESSRISKVC